MPQTPITYLIDGYNLIFSLLDDSKDSIQTLRQKVIATLHKKFVQLKISGILVFDGAHRKGEVGEIVYSHPLVIAYAPKGQTADFYIVEEIERSPNPKQIIVVTNDKGLGLHARAQGAQVISNRDFLQVLDHRSKKKKRKEIVVKDTQQNIDRLLKIFEERLEQDLED